MMFGTRENFEYFQCTGCQCLQISHTPEDLDRHYPNNYYSFASPPSRGPNFVATFLLKQRFRSIIFNRGFKVSRIASCFVNTPDLRVDEVTHVANLLRTAKIGSFSARFLDIGCGTSSTWLLQLKTMGFRNLIGIDPHIRSSQNTNGIRILKGGTEDIKGEYDLITFHHSLEHIPDQLGTLIAASRLLAPRGTILVRIPIVSSQVWTEYGTNWVELDAPRHLFLHSDCSIRICGDHAGLDLYERIGDSLDFEFYGSEQYRKDIPLTDPESYWINRSSNLFSQSEITYFKQRADEANRNGTSGRACFFFGRKEHSH
jgi:SAM-dependent methyltransferase